MSLQTVTIEVPHADVDAALLQILEERLRLLLAQVEEGDSEVAVVLTDDASIQQLNRDYREVDAATDVLSFPMREGEEDLELVGAMLGDIVISVATAQRNLLTGGHDRRVAAELGESGPLVWGLTEELSFLMIHGLLHLLGHDHAEPEEEQKMKAAELALMKPFLRLKSG